MRANQMTSVMVFVVVFMAACEPSEMPSGTSASTTDRSADAGSTDCHPPYFLVNGACIDDPPADAGNGNGGHDAAAPDAGEGEEEVPECPAGLVPESRDGLIYCNYPAQPHCDSGYVFRNGVCVPDGSDPGGTDAGHGEGTPPDSGIPPDAGSNPCEGGFHRENGVCIPDDFVSPDAGNADAGSTDAGSTDGSDGTDAGPADASQGADAGSTDGSTTPDAGGTDSGNTDAGGGSDASNPTDAGTPADEENPCGNVACLADIDDDGEDDEYCAKLSFFNGGSAGTSACRAGAGAFMITFVGPNFGLRSATIRGNYLCSGDLDEGQWGFNWVCSLDTDGNPVTPEMVEGFSPKLLWWRNDQARNAALINGDTAASALIKHTEGGNYHNVCVSDGTDLDPYVPTDGGSN